MTESTLLTELWQLDARTLAGRIRAGEITAAAAVQAHIDRIKAVNPALNALCWDRFDAALDEARDADRRAAEGAPLGPLHGVPITVKECIDVDGAPVTFGVLRRRDNHATGDAAAVRRLREAGAIVLGTTNVSQVLAFVETDNPVYGRTNNPWALDRSPGGSSGGQSALLAAGGVPLGLGTDIGGSVRIPAAFCGLTSLKPTAGRHPDPGRGSFPVGQQAIASQLGPMARTVADLVLVMQTLDGDEATPPLRDPATVDIAGLRVGMIVDDGQLSPAPAVRRAVEEAAAALTERGAQVVAWQPPDVDEAVRLMFSVLAADSLHGIRRTVGKGPWSAQLTDMVRGSKAPRWLIPGLVAVLRASGRGKLARTVQHFGARDADEYFQLVEQLIDYREQFAAALDSAPGGPLDALVLPAAALPAVRHGATAELGLIGAYTALMNVLGYPAGIVPVTRVRPGEECLDGRTADKMDRTAAASEVGSAGLPVGVQVAARPWRDHVALAAMAAIEATVRDRPGFPHTPIDIRPTEG